MAQAQTIARPYAKAVFALASEQNSQKSWQQFLDAAASLTCTPEVMQHLHAPGFIAKLEQWLDDWLNEHRKQGLADPERNLINMLAEQGRIEVLPEIATAFTQLSSADNDTCIVQVRSAQPLNEQEKQELTRTLKKKIGKSVVLEIEDAPELLAGVTIAYDGKIIDQSLRGRLQNFARTLDD